MKTTWLFAAALAAALLPSRAETQQARNEFTFEASALRAGAGYARRVAPATLIGVEIGLGVPMFDRTLSPRSESRFSPPELEEFLHLAGFLRFQPNRSWEIDTGVRVGVVDLYECTASDCWPAGFVGAYVQPMFGWRNVKLGARLFGGLVGESVEGGPDSSSFAVGVTPFLVRATLPW